MAYVPWVKITEFLEVWFPRPELHVHAPSKTIVILDRNSDGKEIFTYTSIDILPLLEFYRSSRSSFTWAATSGIESSQMLKTELDL